MAISQDFLKALNSLEHISCDNLSDYKTLRHDIKFECKFHGTFYAKPVSLFTTSFNGCMGCKRINIGKDFIEKASILHNSKYLYNVEDYICSRTKMKITCPLHGDFYQLPSAHIQGQGCDKCGLNDTSITKRVKGVDILKKESFKKFGNNFSFLEDTYSTTKNKMKIVCPVHKVIEITPAKHLSLLTGCEFCESVLKQKEATETFVNKLEKLYPEKFDTSKVVYINNTTSVVLKCKEHNEYFEQKPLKMLDPKRNCSCKTCYKLSTNRWTIEAVSRIPEIDSKVGFIYTGKISNIDGVKVGVCSELTQRHRSYERDLEQYPEHTFKYSSTVECNYLTAYIIEKIVQDVFRPYRILQDDVKFGGYTELFIENKHEQIVQMIQNLLLEDLSHIKSHKSKPYKNVVDKYKKRYNE